MCIWAYGHAIAWQMHHTKGNKMTTELILANAVSTVMPEIVAGQNALDLADGFRTLAESLECANIELQDSEDAVRTLRTAARDQAQHFATAAHTAGIQCGDLRTEIGQAIVSFTEALMPKAAATYQKKIAQNVRRAIQTGTKIVWKAAKGAPALLKTLQACYNVAQSGTAKDCKDAVATIKALREIASVNGLTLTEPDKSK